jgi:glycosyltransferase involved in cell wall biosynthesis
MRVTHVITRLVVGGAQENTVATVLGLRQRPGFEISLISGPTRGPEGTLAPLFRDAPGVLTEVPTLVRAIHPLYDYLTLRRLTKMFRAQAPHIVHTHSGKAGILGRLAAHRAGVPIIVHTIHGPSFGEFQGVFANAVFMSAERRAGRVTSHFVSVAEAMTRQYLAAGIGRPEHYSKIYSGFALEPFLHAKNDLAERARWNIDVNDIVIGVMARLFKLKGHDDLLDVAPAVLQRAPHVKFLLIGDGAWRGRLERRVQSMGLQNNFIFTGLVPPTEIPRYVGLMDCLVHLSRREGLPRALPQALAAARPVVTYDCDGAAEVCLTGRTGFLVAPGDRATLTDRLVQLALEPALRERLGAAGRDFVRPLFSVEAMLEKLAALYHHLAAQTPK